MDLINQMDEILDAMSQDMLRFFLVLSQFIVGTAIIASSAQSFLRIPESIFWIVAVAFLSLPYWSNSLRRSDPMLFRLGLLTFFLGLVVFFLPRE